MLVPLATVFGTRAGRQDGSKQVELGRNGALAEKGHALKAREILFWLPEGNAELGIKANPPGRDAVASS